MVRDIKNGEGQVHPDKCKGGFNTIEAPGLENTSQAIRVENHGGGEVSALFFCLGKASRN